MRVELLSPAGSFATLKAVAATGADAVYGAGSQFGARAYANNFSQEELLEAIDYLHIRNKRFYLAVNTLLKESELQHQLYSMIEPLYRQGLDGAIIQDIGVLSFLKKHFPKLSLHASTQMSIMGSFGAQLLKDLGCSRVVVARELGLYEIREIHRKVEIEIESFVHGALCYSYSGQCLFSSLLGGRSGNRGRCAQPCRLPYSINGRKASYLLSLKDLCTIELLPEILKSGVCSLKIEGRMKQTDYAAGVTAIYRAYLDQCLENPNGKYKVKRKDLEKLADLGSRSGFTKGYYLGDAEEVPQNMITFEKPAFAKNPLEPKEARALQVKITGMASLSHGKPAKLTLQFREKEVGVNGDIVQRAKNQALSYSDIEQRLKKTGNTPFVVDDLEIKMEEDVFLPVGALNQLRRDGIAALTDALLEEYLRKAPPVLAEAGQEIENAETSAGVTEQCFQGEPYLAVSIEQAKQLKPVLQRGCVDVIYLDSHIFTGARATAIHKAGKKFFYLMPRVFRLPSSRWHEAHLDEILESKPDGFVARNYDELGFLRKKLPEGIQILADSGLYCWNRIAKETLACGVTLPLELNENELRKRSFSGGELIIYGYLPLMLSAQSVHGDALVDRYGKQFSAKSLGDYNVVYNSVPLSLFHLPQEVESLSADGHRISFTIEDAVQVEEVMDCYEAAYLLKNHTKGHYKRGVM